MTSFERVAPTAYSASCNVVVTSAFELQNALNILSSSKYNGMFTNLGEYMTAIYMLPFKFTAGAVENVSILVGDKAINCRGYTISSLMNGGNPDFIARYKFKLEDRKTYITGTFVDFSLSSYQLFLPYFGAIELQPDVFTGSDIEILYGLDPSTGWLNVKVINESSDILIYENTTTVGTFLPISSTNAGSVNAYKKAALEEFQAQQNVTMMNGVAGILSAAVTGNIGNAIMPTANLVTSLYLANPTKNKIENTPYSATCRTGNVAAAPMFSTTDPYIFVFRQRYNTPLTYGHDVGYPCQASYKVSELTGYCYFDKIHIKGINATATEITEIEQLLTNGVIINNGDIPPLKPVDPPIAPDPPTPSYSALCPFKGRFKVTAVIGETTYPYSQTSPHKGLDLVTLDGSDVLALNAGWKVIKKGWENPNDHSQGAGYYVKLGRSEDVSGDEWYGYELLYMHLKENSCPLVVGQNVIRGAKIGEMGSTGNVTGPHLHLEMRNRNTPSEVQTSLITYTHLLNKIGNYNYDWETGKLTEV